MNIAEVIDKHIWDTYLNQCQRKTFLQTYKWGEFQKDLGKKILRLAFLDENNTLLGISLCIYEKTPFGTQIYLPRGPLMTKETPEVYKSILNALVEYFENKNISCIKIDPAFTQKEEIAKVPQNIDFKHSINFIQSETNWMIDLVGNTEEELLTWCKEHGMSKNYPTYIRKARREGIDISFSNNIEDWKLFHTYLQKSGERKSFDVRPLTYFTTLHKYFSQNGVVRLGVAKRNGNILAMILIAVYGDEISCLYSAQTDIDTKLRAPMLLRWECMLMGQREGIKRFNNWGVLPEERYKPSNPGFGYSQYKRGFGGYLEQIERTYEYVYNKKLYPIQRLYDRYIKFRYYRYR
jgi:lipid II:glycine glycyltransferase (peptidoglycan interpeptide bridge formation enzyme)